MTLARRVRYFHQVDDPYGQLAVQPWARERGREAEYLLAFLRAVWAEGVDAGGDAGLRLVVERARLDAEGWRAELEANRSALFELGLWGVPSFCVRGPAPQAAHSTWGQDRLWRVEQEVARRGAPP